MRFNGRLTIAALAVLLAAPALAQPRIQLSETKWDFGTIWHGDKPTRTLIITNTGSAPLQLTRVQASCGCTAMQPAKMLLQPGEATEVVASYDSHGKQGPQTSSVTIFSNDPANPEVKFDIKGEVKRAVTTEPMGGLVIRALDPSKTLEGKVTLTNHEAEPFKIEVNYGEASKLFDFEVVELEPGRKVEIRAKSKPPLTYGTNGSSITVKTGLAREPNIIIPVQARIFERVHLSPPALLFIKQDTKPANRGIEVQYFGDDPNFMVTGICCKNPKFRARVGPKSPPPEWMKTLPPTPRFVFAIQMEIPPGPEIPDEGVVFDITTNDPDYPLLQAVCTVQKDVFQAMTYRKGPAPKPTPTCATLPSAAGKPAEAPKPADAPQSATPQAPQSATPPPPAAGANPPGGH